MDTLRLVEVAGDGALVLMTGDGRRFSLAVDEQVRSAVRRSRNGTQVTGGGGDRPGPREVQARIRSGADAEQVAAQTGLDVDYVRRFEGPVLAERAHVAELARATAVDRGGDPTLSLERVVLDVLTGEGYDVGDIAWDSRRAEGTRWQVVAVSRAGTARTEATWSFDTSTRSLEPVDAEAERLTGVERRRRLSAVRESVFDVERPAAAAARGGTVELLDALARQRGRRPVPAGRPAAPAAEPTGTTPEQGDQAPAPDDAAPADAASADAAPERSGTGPGAATREPSGDREAAEAPEHVDGAPDEPATGLRVVGRTTREGRDDRQGSQAEVSIEPDLLSELELDQAPARAAAPRVPPPAVVSPTGTDARRSRRRRAAVPSWDEIVFGAKREDS